ncbi:T-box transcription factor T-A-like [Ambystoma mexicanum]|uniref:T-box transcription factor T-A-like n=1 Tax=Ambystoma mexicanum TaxID=8296 RepID=UPI0037E77871
MSAPVVASERLEHVFSAAEGELRGVEDAAPQEREVSVCLQDKELWGDFQQRTNEMIVTKTGRRMFPVLKVRISGLDPSAMYSVLLDFVAADGNRWKYVNGEWIPGGKPEPQSPSCVYIHPDSPNFGAHWMKADITFCKVKLSNKMNGGGQIMLNSLHKYEPRIHVMKVGGPQKMINSFAFPETQFIAVTAYQNEEITALKIKHNPFAKAFLDAKERSDTRDVLDNGDPQSGYSQIGGWFLPAGSGSFCSSGTSSPFAGSPSLPAGPGSYCERYSGLRNHRSAPYPAPYGQRNTSPSHYVDTSGAFSMLPAHDGWSNLGLSASSGVLPLTSSTTSASSQYTSLWSLGNSNSPSPAPSHSPSGFLRGSTPSYNSLASPLQTPSASPSYDGALAEVPTSDSQYDSTIARLASSWATVTQTY